MPPSPHPKNTVKKATLSHPKKEKTNFEVTVNFGEPQSSSVYWGEFVDVAGVFFVPSNFPIERTEVHQSPLPSLPLENRPSPESSSRFWYGGTGVVLIA